LFFARKAAPECSSRKLILRLINNLAAAIDLDSITRDRLKVSFPPDYRIGPGAADSCTGRFRTGLDRRL
jgi:glucan phosphorylase